MAELDLQVLLVHQDYKAKLVIQEEPEAQVQLVYKVPWVPRVEQALPEQQASMAEQVQLV
jgi:hypothetical protein